MKRICRLLLLTLLTSLLVGVNVSAADKESIVDYAMKWNNNPNILYQYAGPGRGHSLEDCDKNKWKTDCSGFVSSVYSHFGYNIGGSSSEIYKKAKKKIYNQKDAKPGDVCWWEGHVGIYIGNNKMIHTNQPTEGKNKIHITEFKPSGPCDTPSAYLRVVDDVGKLGTPKQSTETKVKQAKATGSVILESDITGMPIESSLRAEQQRLNLMSRDDLTADDIATLDYIASVIDADEPTEVNWFYRITAFIGILLLVYGIGILVCLIFDYTNTFIDISLLSIISLGKWKVVSKADVQDGLVKVGYDAYRKVTFLTVSALVIRAVIVIIIAFLLLSGVIGKGIGYIWGLIF